MRRISIVLLATASLVALASTASAADLARGGYKAPLPPPRPACAQFGGFYAGANVGWAYHDKKWVDRDAWVDNFSNDWALGTVSTTTNGVTGGLQAGYNWQRNCTVFGFEADIAWADLNSTKGYGPSAGTTGTVLTLRDKLDWYGTLRTRSGVVVDDLLLYVTGGAAFARIKHDFTVTDPNVGAAGTTEAFSAKSSRWGWVGGLGVEWAVTQNISIKSEVLYIRFNEVTTRVLSPAGDQFVNFDNQDSMWVSRLGINFRFGGGPVYAAY